MRVHHVSDGNGAHYGYSFRCPGCDDMHVIPTKPYGSGWSFNGDYEAPTFSPSILVQYNGADADTPGGNPSRCHSFVRDGRIEYLSDSTHKLVGSTVPLPDIGPRRA